MSDNLEALFEDLLEDAKRDKSKRENLAVRNESFVASSQDDLTSWQESAPSLFFNNRKRLVIHNYLASIIETYSARLLKFNPYPKAYGVSASPEDQLAAKITNSIIEQKTKEDSYDNLIYDIVKQGAIHCCAGLKIYYSKSIDEVKWDFLSFFDFYLDPCASSVDTANWVIFEKHIDKRKAERMLKDFPAEKDALEEENYRKTASGETRSGVPVRELWMLPGYDEEYPNGLFALFVGHKLIIKEDFPPNYHFVVPETGKKKFFLPLVLFTPSSERNTAYGKTPTDEAIEPQRSLNNLETNLADLERKVSNVKLLTNSTSIMSSWNSKDQILQLNMDDFVRWSPQPEMPPLMMNNRQEYLDKLYKLFGLSEISAGQAELKSHTYGKQIAYLSELDGQKTAGALKSIRAMVLSAWKKTLALMQHYYITERLAKFTNSSDLEINTWKGSMLMGADISLEPVDGLEKYQATKAQDQVERMKLGLENPQTVSETSQTGLTETTFENVAIKQIDAEIDAALKGSVPLPQNNPMIALPRIDQMIGALRAMDVPVIKIANVQMLKQAYLQKQQEMSAQKAAAQNQQPDQGGII